MKMHLVLTALTVLVSLTTTVPGATYSTGFDTPPYTASADVAGQDGWTINDPTPRSSFFVNLNSSLAGALGGYYDAPASTSVDLTHGYGDTLGGASFAVDFALIGSSALAPGSDSFGYSFRDAANNTLLRVAFEPNPVVPLTEPSLKIVYYDSANTRISTQSDLFYGAIYQLAISFGTSAANGTFSATLTAGIGSPLTWGGTLVGAGAAMLATFGVDFDVNGPTGASSGDNYMIFDNLKVTGPAPVVLPTLSITLNASNKPVISFQGVLGSTYQILRSTTLQANSWSNQQTLTPPANGAVEFTDPDPPVGTAFYRAYISSSAGAP